MSAPIRSKPSNEEYRTNFERIFGKREQPRDHGKCPCGAVVVHGKAGSSGADLVCSRCFPTMTGRGDGAT